MIIMKIRQLFRSSCATEMHLILFSLFAVSLVAGEERGTVLPDDVAHMSDREIIHVLVKTVTRLEAERVKQEKRIEALEDTVHRQNDVITALQKTMEDTTAQEKTNVQSADEVMSNQTKDLEQTRPEKKIAKVRRAIRQAPDTKVAFSSILTLKNLSHLGAHQSLHFDEANVNTNNVYNPHHGVFIAPVPGIYVITATVLANQDREVYCDIVVNGNVVAKMYGRGTDSRHDQGSQTILVQLKQGDDVCVQNEAVDDSIYGDRYTSFSGFLLYEEESTAIIG